MSNETSIVTELRKRALDHTATAEQYLFLISLLDAEIDHLYAQTFRRTTIIFLVLAIEIARFVFGF
jgi:hypothetical protein